MTWQLRGAKNSEASWDVFISHASEDKQGVALPLAAELERYGYRVWLDSWELEVGDSLRQKIEQGLQNSRLRVVILSASFSAKPWPQAELDSLFSSMLCDAGNVFPVWHQITSAEVQKYYPLLAGRLAARTSDGITSLAQRIASRLGARGKPLELVVDLSTLQVSGPAVPLKQAISDSEDLPGSYTNRRIDVKFINGVRREQKEIERGIRWLLFFEPLTFPVRHRLASAMFSFVRKYDYSGPERCRTKVDIWLRDDDQFSTGIWITEEEEREIRARIPSGLSQMHSLGQFSNDMLDLGFDLLATQVIPQLLFKFFRYEQQENRDLSREASRLLSIFSYTWGPG